MVGWQTPVNVKITVRIHRDDAFDAAGAPQGDFAVFEVNFGVGQIQFQFLRRKNQSHVPNAFFSKWLRFSRHTRRQFLSAEIRQIKIAVRVQREFDLRRVCAWRARQHDPPPLNAGLSQIHPKFGVPFHLEEGGMPFAISPEGPRSPQNPVRVLLRRNVAQGQSILREQSWRSHVPGQGDDDVARTPDLEREKIIGFHQAAIGHLHLRMVAAQLAKDDIESDNFCPLGCQLLHQPAIDGARPVKPEVESQRPAVAHVVNAALVNENEPQVGGHAWGEIERLPGPHVVSHTFQALDEIQAQQPHPADDRDHAQRNQHRDAFDRLELHSAELNKKTRATQGCPGFGFGK